MNHHSVEETVKLVGYKNIFSLRNAFKKVEGISVVKYANSVCNKDDKLREELTKTLEQNFRKPEFNICLFAKTLGISERSLYRKFVKLFGVAPMQILENKRIEYAVSLLKEESSITTVTRMSGYRTVAAFRMAFRKIMGEPFVGYVTKLNEDRMQSLMHRIESLLGIKLADSDPSQIKLALKDELSIYLPQRVSLLESLASSASEHKIIGLLIDYEIQKMEHSG